MAGRRICLTFDPSRRTDALAEAVPAADVVELRADLLPPDRLAAGNWKQLPALTRRDWVFTWRSPGEGGGGGDLPRGLRSEAIASGYRWIDVEAQELETGDPEAVEIAPERRWVSMHPSGAPEDRDRLTAWSRTVRRHPAALHKLVVPADRFAVSRWVLDLAASAPAAEVPFTVFAQGNIGHVTRVLGGLWGNAVTFAAIAPEAGTAPGQPTLDRLRTVYRFADVPGNAAVYGVVGNPALHSRSPELHNAVFEQLGIAAIYLPLESESAAPVVAWMREGGVAGLSVTAPFKLQALSLADVVLDRAALAGAANTLWMEGDRLHADNTDVLAAEVLLGELDPAGTVAVLGAGGAAAAVVAAARSLGLKTVVFNRDPDRGSALAARLGAEAGGHLDRFDPAGFTGVVNTTPPGSWGPADAGEGWTGTTVIDLTYAAEPTAWEVLARDHDLTFRGGLRFLAEQAAGQCARWTGTTVPVARFLEVLEA